ncbi:ATP-binding protein [Pseudokineococcus sp. 5B2Z-1]|uniref:sensor histidine kinase n=1 Tax=Pseudokineococcus sp. 5B2Z-1 TaxID=3132744 RepID=UPI0030A1E8C9
MAPDAPAALRGRPADGSAAAPAGGPGARSTRRGSVPAPRPTPVQGGLERGRHVYTSVVVVLEVLVVAAAFAAAALAPDGGSPTVVAAAAATAAWLVLAVVHLLRPLPLAVLPVVGLVSCTVLPVLVGSGTPGEADAVLRVLATAASVVLWSLAGAPGPVRPVLARAVAGGGAAAAVVCVSAHASGLSAPDLVGPLVTAVLAVVSLLVADRSARRAERSLAAQRAAAVDLLVARDLAAARRRLDARLHDVVLGTLAALVTADAERSRAARELAAEALAVLVAAGPDAERAGAGASRRAAAGAGGPGAVASGGPVDGLAPRTDGHGGRASSPAAVDAGPVRPPTGPEAAEEDAAERLAAGLARLVARADAEGLAVQVRREDDGGAPAPVPAPPGAAGAVDALLGAVGECLRNVVRHAGTSSALVVWSTRACTARALVVDAGRGFDPAAVPAGSLGLARSVRDRVEDVGGTVGVRSRPGRGTVVAMAVPLGAGGPPADGSVRGRRSGGAP